MKLRSIELIIVLTFHSIKGAMSPCLKHRVLETNFTFQRTVLCGAENKANFCGVTTSGPL